MSEKTVVKTTCAYCGTGCGLILEIEDNKITRVRGDREAPINKGQTCIKGALGYHYMHADDRLKTPLIRENGELVPTTWEKALNVVATKLMEIKDQFGSDALSIFACARATNETNYITQKFARAVLGTNNIDGCNRT